MWWSSIVLEIVRVLRSEQYATGVVQRSAVGWNEDCGTRNAARLAVERGSGTADIGSRSWMGRALVTTAVRGATRREQHTRPDASRASRGQRSISVAAHGICFDHAEPVIGHWPAVVLHAKLHGLCTDAALALLGHAPHHPIR